MDRKNTYTRRLLLSRLLIAAVAMAFLISCHKDEKRDGAGLQEFVKRTECGLWGHGGFLFRYDEENCQFSINPARKQARMQSDNQEDYVNVTFSSFPTPALMKVEAALRYKVGNEEITSKCLLETVKIEDNKFWLWDSGSNLGIIIWCSPQNHE